MERAQSMCGEIIDAINMMQEHEESERKSRWRLETRIQHYYISKKKLARKLPTTEIEAAALEKESREIDDKIDELKTLFAKEKHEQKEYRLAAQDCYKDICEAHELASRLTAFIDAKLLLALETIKKSPLPREIVVEEHLELHVAASGTYLEPDIGGVQQNDEEIPAVTRRDSEESVPVTLPSDVTINEYRSECADWSLLRYYSTAADAVYAAQRLHESLARFRPP